MIIYLLLLLLLLLLITILFIIIIPQLPLLSITTISHRQVPGGRRGHQLWSHGGHQQGGAGHETRRGGFNGDLVCIYIYYIIHILRRCIYIYTQCTSMYYNVIIYIYIIHIIIVYMILCDHILFISII